MGPRTRLAIAGVYLVIQAALVLSAGKRADRTFGFRMAAESSTLVIALSREVRSNAGEDSGVATVPVAFGEWVARDASGKPRRIAWRERIHQAELTTFDTAVESTSSAESSLAHLQAALDDVASHTPDDAETRALVADVIVQKNGREPYSRRLRSDRQ
jgi:hypothetical protein